MMDESKRRKLCSSSKDFLERKDPRDRNLNRKHRSLILIMCTVYC